MYLHHVLKAEDVDWNTPEPVMSLKDGDSPIPVPGETEVL